VVAAAAGPTRFEWKRCCLNASKVDVHPSYFHVMPFPQLADPLGEKTVGELKTELLRLHKFDPADRDITITVSNAFVILFEDTMKLRDAWPDGTASHTVYYAFASSITQVVRPQAIAADKRGRFNTLEPICELVPGVQLLFAGLLVVSRQLSDYPSDAKNRDPSIAEFLEQVYIATRCPALVSATATYIQEPSSELAKKVAGFVSQGLTSMCASLLSPLGLALSQVLEHSRECFAFLLIAGKQAAALSMRKSGAGAADAVSHSSRSAPFEMKTFHLDDEDLSDARAPHTHTSFVGATLDEKPTDVHVHDSAVLQWRLSQSKQVISKDVSYWTPKRTRLVPDPLLRTLFLLRTSIGDSITLAVPKSVFIDGQLGSAAQIIYPAPIPELSGRLPVVENMSTYTRLVDSADFVKGSFRIINPRSLRSQRELVMTVRGNGTLSMYSSLSKETDNVNVTDPLRPGHDTSIKFEEESTTLGIWLLGNKDSYLAKVLASRTGGTQGDAPTVEDSRPTTEAVILLLDCSGSMDSASSFPDMTRIVLSQQVAASFLDRLASYNLPHRVQLCSFSSTFKVLNPFTSIFSNVESKVRALRTEGQTSLFDSIIEATKQLQSAFPSAKVDKRIFVLSDGEDNCSKNTALAALSALAARRVIVDAVCIGSAEDAGFHKLKGICLASGGLCLRASTTQELFHFFEAETMLALGSRPPATPMAVSDASALDRIGAQAFSKIPRKPLPTRFTTEVMSPMEALIKAARMRRPESDNAAAVTAVMRALRAYVKNPHPFVRVYPSDDSVFFWLFILEGPDQSPYEGGNFLGLIEFPKEFPVHPPHVRLVTPMYHCNVNDDGKICHSVLDRNWERTTSLRTVLDCIYGLLLIPEPDDPLDTIKASLFHNSPVEYAAKAKASTEQHARGRLKDLLKEITPLSDAAEQQLLCSFPARLTDPLTQMLFVDPVVTPDGLTYSRAPLVRWLETHGTDPKTRKPLKESQLRPDLTLARDVEDFQRRGSDAVDHDSWFA
jgi:ubiquitin-protein ligase/Mg-chelatase subunit ChlD